MDETCTWTQQDHYESGWWASDCGHEFVFEEGEPLSSEFRFCCFCGKALVEERMIDDDDTTDDTEGSEHG